MITLTAPHAQSDMLEIYVRYVIQDILEQTVQLVSLDIMPIMDLVCLAL